MSSDSSFAPVAERLDALNSDLHQWLTILNGQRKRRFMIRCQINVNATTSVPFQTTVRAKIDWFVNLGFSNRNVDFFAGSTNEFRGLSPAQNGGSEPLFGTVVLEPGVDYTFIPPSGLPISPNPGQFCLLVSAVELP